MRTSGRPSVSSGTTGPTIWPWPPGSSWATTGTWPPTPCWRSRESRWWPSPGASWVGVGVARGALAVPDQGAYGTYRGPEGSHIGVGESMRDTARVLSRMYDGIEYRGFSQEIV